MKLMKADECTLVSSASVQESCF